MNTSVAFPARAAKALGYLKARRNDVEIFVEDSAGQNLWVKLLRHYLPNHAKLESVNVLGSKERVLKACSLDQEHDNRRKLYFIDGDLDLLRGIGKPRLKNLYRLRSYCVENYLLDEETLISAITTLNVRVDYNVARKELDLRRWFERNRGALYRLFVCYAVSFELKQAQQTVGFRVYKLLNWNNSYFDFCERRVAIRVIGLYRSVRLDFSQEEVREVYERIRKNAERIGEWRFVSAKDYLVPQLYKMIKRKFGTNLSLGSFLALLAESASDGQDPYLRRRLRGLWG